MISYHIINFYAAVTQPNVRQQFMRVQNSRILLKLSVNLARSFSLVYGANCKYFCVFSFNINCMTMMYNAKADKSGKKGIF